MAGFTIQHSFLTVFFHSPATFSTEPPALIPVMKLISRNPGKCNASDDKSVRYNDSDEWPAHSPVGMWIDYGLVNEFLRE